MLLDDRLFNEIMYINPSDASIIAPLSDTMFTDYDIISDLMRNKIEAPQGPNESDDEYDTRLDHAFDGNIQIGVIPRDSVLKQALTNYQQAHPEVKLNWYSIDDDDLKRLYFDSDQYENSILYDANFFIVDADSNNDPVDMYLFDEHGSDQPKRRFLQFINEH